MLTYMGIDPGKTGAVAILSGDGVISALGDMPLTPDGRIDAAKLFQLFSVIKPDICFIEKSQAMPGQGVTSMFSYGCSYGLVLAALQIAGVSFQEIRPQAWKKEFSLIKKDKNESVAVALNLFPGAEVIRDKRNGGEGKVYLHGRADALLMAEYAKRKTKNV